MNNTQRKKWNKDITNFDLPIFVNLDDAINNKIVDDYIDHEKLSDPDYNIENQNQNENQNFIIINTSKWRLKTHKFISKTKLTKKIKII
jgi:hypothetical protein